jgi:hypothetical protein
LVTFLCTGKEKLPARPQAEWKLLLKQVTRSADSEAEAKITKQPDANHAI